MVANHQEIIHHGAAGGAVARGEGVDVLKAAVEIGRHLQQLGAAVAADFLHQVVQFPAHIPGGGAHRVYRRDVIPLFQLPGALAVD